MVVPVLMTSCQVSEKWKTGPSSAHAMMTPTAPAKASELPVQTVTTRAECSSHPLLPVPRRLVLPSSQLIGQRERGNETPVRACNRSPISCTRAKRRGSSTKLCR